MDNDEKRFKIKQKDMYNDLYWKDTKDSAIAAVGAAVMGMISIINFFIWGTSLISPLLFEEILDKLNISVLSIPRSLFGWIGFLGGSISSVLNNEYKQSETNRSVFLAKYLEYKDNLDYLEQLSQNENVIIDSVSYYEQDIERSRQKFVELQKEISLDDDLENGIKR